MSETNSKLVLPSKITWSKAIGIISTHTEEGKAVHSSASVYNSIPKEDREPGTVYKILFHHGGNGFCYVGHGKETVAHRINSHLANAQHFKAETNTQKMMREALVENRNPMVFHYLQAPSYINIGLRTLTFPPDRSENAPRLKYLLLLFEGAAIVEADLASNGRYTVLNNGGISSLKKPTSPPL